jgi:hypothetical protein
MQSLNFERLLPVFVFWAEFQVAAWDVAQPLVCRNLPDALYYFVWQATSNQDINRLFGLKVALVMTWLHIKLFTVTNCFRHMLYVYEVDFFQQKNVYDIVQIINHSKLECPNFEHFWGVKKTRIWNQGYFSGLWTVKTRWPAKKSTAIQFPDRFIAMNRSISQAMAQKWTIQHKDTDHSTGHILMMWTPY